MAKLLFLNISMNLQKSKNGVGFAFVPQYMFNYAKEIVSSSTAYIE